MENIVTVRHRSVEEIRERLPLVRRSPRDLGALALAVCRPAVDAREVLSHAELDLETGLIGDGWSRRAGSRTDPSPNPERQLTVINSRFIELIAGPDRDAWALAGDQLYVDLDLSVDALPTGSRLAIGDRAVIEVTEPPHNGCAKFAARFGRDAHKIVWTEEGQRLRLRGLNARVIVGAPIATGDAVRVTLRSTP
ncbi:hypothetical protein [Actinoplanes subtropicus]|uniref:hypothetical protein n=1 Tax=Actinoplanes subtropicus TaxID=543632 RepID=UPI0004C42A4F|nr:hypothetical protein [Actinoplanes subtropicus]